MKKIALLTVFVGLLLYVYPVASTSSEFVDTVTISGNSFSTKCWDPPSSPTLESPLNQTATDSASMTFSWDSSTTTCPNAALTYNFQFFSDSNLTNLVAESGFGSSLSYIYSSIPVGSYFWRVQVQDPSGNIINSSAFSITINPSIVLNEIMYNPTDPADAGTMPHGEWVELYNNSNSDVDVAGWKITDAISNTITVSTSNSDNNNNTADSGETVVPTHGFLVVYRNGSAIFNNTGDTVNLLNSANVLQDSHTYAGGKADGATEARIPDGTGAWVDPVATPGKPNKLTQDPSPSPSPDVSAQPVASPSPSISPDPSSSPSASPSPSTSPDPSDASNSANLTSPSPSASPSPSVSPSEQPSPSPSIEPSPSSSPVSS